MQLPSDLHEHIFTILGYIIGAAGALALAILGYRKLPTETRKTANDAAGAITDAAIELVEPLRKEIVTLRAENAELKQQLEAVKAQLATVQVENAELRRRVSQLEKQDCG